MEHDTRPDLVEDHKLWEWLLSSVHDDLLNPESLYGTLRGVRACGARLELAGGAVRLRPGDYLAPAWEADRDRWLAPHRYRLTEALKGLIDYDL